jgi:hypothetical protein
VQVLRAEGSRLQSGSKTTWVLAILFLGAFGALLYRVAGSPREHEVRHDTTKRLYWCTFCPFESKDVVAAGDHRDGRTPRSAGSPRSHVVFKDPRDSLYWCGVCAFWTRTRSAAATHAGERTFPLNRRPSPSSTPGGPASNDAYLGFPTAPAVARAASDAITPSPEGPVTELAAPRYKPCPDCAEEIRFAARKCRFCGYTYDVDAAVSSAGGAPTS